MAGARKRVHEEAGHANGHACLILNVFNEVDVGGVAAGSCAHSGVGISVVYCCVDYWTLVDTCLGGWVSETTRANRDTCDCHIVSISIVWTASWDNTC